MTLRWSTAGLTTFLASILLLLAASCNATVQDEAQGVDWDSEYRALEATVGEGDKAGLAAIKALHHQLDDDHDGTIEPQETGDFIKADLKHDGDGRRQKLFHKKDAEITVADLWSTWVRSEVHNWTVEQTADWLSQAVDLPQYAGTFIKGGVTGSQLPLAASDPAFLSKVLGITNSIHRSKISLKAMDVVLFGPPKEPSHWLKDVILTSLLVALTSALLWAYRTKKLSEEHINKMMQDMESLAKAEQALQEMQSRVDTGEQVREQKGESNTEEVAILKEEVEILREELQRAEVELEDKCWVAPTVLQHWLQLTHELESQVYNAKRQTAESQIESAKDACEKLKRKRSSLVGAFVSTHGRSIEDVDKSIMEAKSAMMELTQDLAERSQRWRQIEMLTGVGIVNNPGLGVLQRLVRHVGAGNRGLSRGGGGALSSRMSSMDDLGDDLETRSLAASVASHSSHLSGSVLSSRVATRRRPATQKSRESSKESSNSESDGGTPSIHEATQRLEKTMSRLSAGSDVRGERRTVAAAESRSLAGDCRAAVDSPTQRRARMAKSLSQDTGCCLTEATTASLPSSTSDSALNSKVTAAPSPLLPLSPHLRAIPQPHQLSEVEESCSASDTGSCTDLTGQTKKKKSFFNFRKKKEKVTAS